MQRLIISAILLVASAPVGADLVADVRCQEVAFSRAAEARDLASFVSFLDVDARFVGNGVLRGPDEIAAAWQVFFADDGPTIKWRPQFVEVLASGDLALTRGPYRVLAKGPDGEAVEEWGTFNSVWRKDADDTWRIILDAGNTSDAEPSANVRALLEQEDSC
jgi:ketosteroid isomerase-like protein